MKNAAAKIDRLDLTDDLRPDESWSLKPEQLDEIRARASEVAAGNVALVDGEDVIQRARARINAHRR